MKKYFIFAVAALAALAACSKIETVESTREVPITFSVMNHLQQTKATAGLEYPKGVPFGTYAWWTENTWASTAAASKTQYVFMENEKIQHVAASGTDPNQWLPEHTYYWTKTGYITFASYSPYVADASAAAAKGYSAVPTYDVTNGFLFPDYTIVDATNVDLMYANLAADCTKSTNTNGADVTDNATPEGGYAGVPTIFNHALCQVGFAFRCVGTKNPNVTEIKVVVTDVDILNISKKGSFTQNNATKWASADRTVAANIADYEYDPATDLELTMIEKTVADAYTAEQAAASYQATAEKRILLPQALVNSSPVAATDQKLSVSYTIMIKYASDPSTYATEQVTSVVNLYTTGLPAWGDNQNITYRITISPYSELPVSFDPAVVGWEDVYSYPDPIVPGN